MKIIEILKNTRAGLRLQGGTQDAGPQDSTQDAGLPDQDSTQDAGLQDSAQAPKPGGLLAVPCDIMNIASNRSQARNGLANTEAAIELLQKIDWKYTFLQDEDGHLTDLLFMPGNCFGLLTRFPSVLFMDCTYKTNRSKLPLQNVVGCTNKYSTFPVAFGLLSRETKDTFEWALHWLNLQLINLGIERKTRVVLTDRELALMNALEGEMPYASNLICIRHIDKVIRGWLKKAGLPDGMVTHFCSLWFAVANSCAEI